RFLAYASAISRHPCARPTPSDAIAIRPRLRVSRNCLNPCPSTPNRFAAGIRQSSKINSAVADERHPILRYCLPARNPGVPLSTTSALISFLPRGSTPVTAAITTISFIRVPAFEMKHLLPLITQLSPTRSALVLVPPASEPADGSVRPKAPSASPRISGRSHLSRCASVPSR